MHIKRKALYAIAVLLTGLFILHACTSSFNSVSGELAIVTFEGSGGGSVYPGQIPFASLKLPGELLTETLVQKMGMGVNLEPEFVPDEIVVKYRPGVEPLMFQSLTLAEGFEALRTGGNVSGGSLSVLKLAHSEVSSLSIKAVRDRTLREIDRLNTLPHVEYAQPNFIYKPLGLLNLPNDEHYHMQWHYPLIKWDHVWDEGLVTDLSGVTVAVIDTGIVRSNGMKSGLNHEDFIDGLSQSPFVDEYDFISDPFRARDGDGYDSDATDVGDNPELSLASFHGTHVMGTIGAYTDNSIGVAGIAGRNDASTSVKIMPLRALGYGGGTTSDIIEAIRYASKTGTYSSWSHTKADVINMSLGSTAQDQALKEAIDDAFAEDIVIVAAAGNNGSLIPFYPAAYTNVISVSAVDIGAQITAYSNFGNTIDVAAPGGDLSYNLNFDIGAPKYADGVLSTFTDSSYDTATYAFYQGTSMAAPHVAGLAALIKAKNPALTASQIRSKIELNVIDLGDTGKDDYYGHGLINAYRAVSDGSEVDPVLLPSPKLFKFKGDNPSDTFTLTNIGNTSSDITINTIIEENNAPWLDVSPTFGVVGTGMNVTISIDSSSISDGQDHIEMLTIQAQDGVGDEYVYVLYNYFGIKTRRLTDIGPLYVCAIDIETTEIIDLVMTTFGELYRYDLNGVPSGSYIIGASTNRDGDEYIFEPDDAYGFYVSLDQIVVVDVISNLHGINFDVIDQYDNPASEGLQKMTR